MTIEDKVLKVSSCVRLLMDLTSILQVTKQKNNYSFTTLDLMKRNDHCEEALKEIFHISYV